MNQLKALIWKSYKVRARSRYSTVLDVVGPIAIIIFYLGLKILLGTLSAPSLEGDIAAAKLFRNLSSNPLDARRDLKRHTCNKILYYSSQSASNSFGQAIGENCGIELVHTSSRDELIDKLQQSLNSRIAFKQAKTNLNKSNSTLSCIALPGKQEPIYQAGIAHDHQQSSLEIHMTDLAGSTVIHQPYSQGSFYNEYRLSHSDLNSGIHLLEICIAKAFRSTVSINSNNVTSNQNNTNSNNTTDNNVTNHDIIDTKWHVKPYPVLTGNYLMPAITMLIVLLAHFCNALATVYRVTEANELGQHHYIRIAGATAGYYWLSLFIVTFIHMTVQSLVIAILMAIPTSEYILDPICDMNIATRWILILSYSLSINTHAIFVGSIFDRSSHALLLSCLFASCYAMYALMIMLQWTPYGYSPYSPAAFIALLNPASNFEALLLVIFAVTMQTNEAFNLSHLPERIIGGGFSDWSVGELWALLIVQCIVWLMLTILVDQLRYSPRGSFLGFIIAFINEIFLCNSFAPKGDRAVEDIKTKSSVAAKSLLSRKDPNRICCSLRHVNVTGPTVMMAHTKGDPLKLTNDQMRMLQPREGKTISKTHQYLVNRNQRSPGGSTGRTTVNQHEQPIILDEAIQQHITWFKTDIIYENLNLDFKFNQVSFILGQTDLKELLFNTLLGLNPIKSGHIIIDGAKYDSTTMNLARSQIGYLSEKEIFYNEMTIFENLQFFGSLRDSSYKNYDSESLYVLSLLHLSSRKDDLPFVLTSRSARKLALGVAAVGYTKLLLLVEPTLSLRWRPRCQVLNLLKKYKSIRSIVVDTSDVDEATAFGDRIVLLKNGKTDLDDAPTRLAKKLCCGYWLVFEPTTGDGLTVNSEAIKSLEKLTNEVFKQDKLDLDVTKRSVYKKINDKNRKEGSKISSTIKSIASGYEGMNHRHRVTVIVKVQQSHQSTQALCTILKMFNQNDIYGFRLAELTYESIEDVLVLRMSRAMYPHLPPDLLLSLQHRTKTRQRTPSGEPSPVSVRKFSSNQQVPKVTRSIFGVGLGAIIKDRLAERFEILVTLLAITIAIVIVVLTLFALKASLKITPKPLVEANKSSIAMGHAQTNADIIKHSDIERLYKYRIGFYIVNGNKSETSAYLDQWKGNKDLVGMVRRDFNETDANYVASLVHKSKDLAASFIFFDTKTFEATVVFEPYLPHAMFASIKTLISYDSLRHTKPRNDIPLDRGGSNDVDVPYFTSRHIYQQSWHEMIRGYLNRRFIYGLGFAFAESIAIGVMVIAPIRHRAESRVVKVRTSYWFGMAIFDLIVSLILICAYLTLFIIVEGSSLIMTLPMFIVLFFYKFATLPIPYVVSLAADSSFNGFLFIVLIYVTICWEFSIHLKTFVEYTLFNDSYIFAIASWMLMAIPISSLIDALTVINQVDRINRLCPEVPAYTATTNIVNLEGIQRYAMIDHLLEKIRECLADGKSGVSTNVFHQRELGILWNIYLIILFGCVGWTFLLTCERFFGILARRFNSVRTTNDPMKTVVRFPDKTSSLFQWDRERDRLISEYIRSMNEVKYVKLMATNCLLLRVWLKPMSDQTSFDKRLSSILEPLYSLGQTKNDIQVELKTTLQIFIRIGDESKCCKVDRIQLIETYRNYVALHGDSIAKFAVVDWTRETLYKILLHGHYNTKSTTNTKLNT